MRREIQEQLDAAREEAAAKMDCLTEVLSAKEAQHSELVKEKENIEKMVTSY